MWWCIVMRRQVGDDTHATQQVIDGRIDKQKASERFSELLRRLASVGLASEVRNGENHSLLVFVRVASEQHMFGEVYRSRVKDWIHGVRPAEPTRETQTTLEKDPMTEAERLRIIYQLITNPEDVGGAGITPKKGEWENVESIFALHDHVYNKEWIKKWSTQWLLTPEDLDDIRNRLGEKIAFYFAFTQSYFTFLLFPASFGLLSWAFLGHYSMLYAIVCSLWTVIFTEYWKHQEHDLALRWGVRGVSSIESKRHEFLPAKEITDPVTGEKLSSFPAQDRVIRQLLQIPFAMACVLVLGSLITMCFGIEVFISEVYDGPFKSYLVFLPTVLLTTGLPLLSGMLTTFATKLNDYENYETDSQYERALTGKIFVLNFITSYLPVFLTAFVYVPFGSLIVPYLDVFSLTVQPFAENEKQMTSPKLPNQFTINPARLRKQVIYFTVTAQIVNFAMEVIVPYLKRQGFIKIKQMQSKRALKSGGLTPSAAAEDQPEEKEFLARVRSEAELDVYDVYTDLREMVVQYGYLALFSVIWPLVPVSFLINNWVELRADAVKICVEMQRPTPWRADTIGPWLDALSFLTWLGSITMSALVYLFSNDGIGPDGSPNSIKGWGLLLSIFFSEHLYLFTRYGISTAISKIDSPGRQKARRERYITRQRLFEESLDQTHKLPALSEKGAEITRDSLEEEARQGSLKESTPEERFWARQKGWKESAQVGESLISRAVPDAKEAEKEKKEL
jgi:anoctamin-10